jgi:alpha-galactosidase
MKIAFWGFDFRVECERIYLKNYQAFKGINNLPFTEVQISGENKDTHLGVKMVNSSEGNRLKYLLHNQTDDRLEIVQKSELVEVKTTFISYLGGSFVRIFTEIKNISAKEIVLEEVSAFVAPLLGDNSIENSKNLHFYKFAQSHHAECQPRRQSFYEYGLFRGNMESQKRIAFANIGSWSTKEELPQGIIENAQTGDFLMFQIESNSSWYYEIGDKRGEYYLYLGGANLPFGGWSKALQPNQTYRTPFVALAYGNSVNGVLGEMTKYRRQIAGKNTFDAHLPAIFNEYMHLSWDSPTAEQTAKIAPIVAQTGVEYYVIDCGWHNEEPGNIIYPYVGQWKESKARFPEGVRKTTDFIRSLGMKAGLWIEPEIIGVQCQEMLGYYDDSCFMQRNGRKIAVMDRYFLDYRNKRVRAYMSETIRRMVEDYGADYIKCDYNQDCGVGTDYASFCAGEGLELCAQAFYTWIKEMTEKYPQVIFEGCSSGGMRMDYKSLSLYPLVSTSDQTDYLKYPYIAGNILSAVVPEQAAVWSYPVGVGAIGLPLSQEYDKKWVEKNISDDRIAMNMINSFLGRMHLASHLELLSERQLALVTEGVSYYKSLTEPKKKALPYFPNGFTSFDAEHIVAGFQTDEKIYLAAWCLNGATVFEAALSERVGNLRIAYPKHTTAKAACENGKLSLHFSAVKQAVFLEMDKIK